MYINIVPLSILVSLIAVVVIVNSIRRFRANTISMFECLFWIGLWVVVAFFVLFPKTADVLASYFGVEHGTELALFTGILLLFSLHLQALVRIERLERHVTTIVRKVALNAHE